MEYSALSYGIILLGNECDVDTLKHEYGHYLHLWQSGLISYTAYVAIPSFIGSKLDLSNKSYYSQPWEYIAEVLGEPERSFDYWPNSEIYASAYWILTRILGEL